MFSVLLIKQKYLRFFSRKEFLFYYYSLNSLWTHFLIFFIKSTILLLFSNRCLHFYYKRLSNFYSSFTEVTACSFKDNFPSHIFPLSLLGFNSLMLLFACFLVIVKFSCFLFSHPQSEHGSTFTSFI